MTSSHCAIFDIDGTLVDSYAFDDQLFRTNVLEVINGAVLRPRWSDYAEVSDSALVREICRDNELDPAEIESKVRSVFGNKVCAHLKSGNPCRPTAGALALWQRIRAERPGRIGIATGGWGHTALMKLDGAVHRPYSSWLNQVELWFSKIERDVIARGVFTSVSDLKRKLLRYIRRYNKEPKTVKWKYFDPYRRITPKSDVTLH